MALPQAFVWGAGGQKLTQEQIDRQREIIAALAQKGDPAFNNAGWLGALGRGLEGAYEGWQDRKLRAEQEDLNQYNTDIMSKIGGLLGGTTDTSIPPAASTGVGQEMAVTSPAPVVAEGEIADYIRESALARGIDPDIALRVAMSEGGVTDPIRQSDFVKDGVREASYGPFQLYMGGGLGNKALEAGIDPRDPNQWRQGVDFALDQAATGGWAPWYGAAKVGVGNRAGLEGARAIGFNRQASQAPAVAAIEDAAPASGFVDPMVSAPNYDASLAAAPSADMANALVGGFDGGRFGGAPVSSFSATPEIYSLPGDFPPEQPAPVPVSTPVAAPIQAAQRRPNISPELIGILSDPRTNAQTRGVAEMLVRQQFAQQQAVDEANRQEADPLRRLQIQKAQMEVDGSRRQPLINAGDGRLYDPNSGQWIQAPGAGQQFRAATPEEARRFGAAAGQWGPDGRFYPLNPPQGTSLSVDPNTGVLTFNQGAGVKPLTEGQSKDAFFTTRMTANVPTIDKFEQTLTAPDQVAADYLPGGRYYQTEEYQLARDAGDDFVAAYLRKDSGAALTKEERTEYGRMLLPQPGDKPAAIAAKRQRRLIAIKALESGMPPQAIDNVIKAIGSVEGADQPAMTTEERKKGNRTSSGVTWSVD